MSPTASDKYFNAADFPALTLLYDGGCPLCLREVELLGRKDQERHGERLKLAFVDIDQADYNPDSYAGISYREAMGRIHAIDGDGAVLRDVEVFRRAYDLIGLGWIYAPTQWPLLSPITNLAYATVGAGPINATGSRQQREMLDSIATGLKPHSTKQVFPIRFRLSWAAGALPRALLLEALKPDRLEPWRCWMASAVAAKPC